MELLNKQLVVKYITDKRDGYRKRRDVSESKGDTQAVNDYNIRILPLDNLLLRINKGEFDVYSVRSDPAPSEVTQETERILAKKRQGNG